MSDAAAVDVTEDSLHVEFDWDQPIPVALALTIAQLGDTAMRLRLMSFPDVSQLALAEVLETGDEAPIIAARKIIAARARARSHARARARSHARDVTGPTELPAAEATRPRRRRLFARRR